MIKEEKYYLISLFSIALISIFCGFLIGWALGYNQFVLEGREFRKELIENAYFGKAMEDKQ